MSEKSFAGKLLRVCCKDSAFFKICPDRSLKGFQTLFALSVFECSRFGLRACVMETPTQNHFRLQRPNKMRDVASTDLPRRHSSRLAVENDFTRFLLFFRHLGASLLCCGKRGSEVDRSKTQLSCIGFVWVATLLRMQRIRNPVGELVAQSGLLHRVQQGVQADAPGVMLGVGLVSGTQTYDELPFDVLGLLLSLSALARTARAQRVFVVIADEHALQVGARPGAVAVLAHKRKRLIQHCCVLVGLAHVEVVLGSALAKDPIHAALRARVAAEVPSTVYGQYQTADVEVLRRRCGGLIKLGWCLPGTSGWDEVAFDELHRRVFGDGVTFVYARPGWSFDARAPRDNPYLLKDPDTRLRLSPEEAPSSRLRWWSTHTNKSVCNGALRHLRRIARAWQHEVGGLEGPLEVRLERILHAVFGERACREAA